MDENESQELYKRFRPSKLGELVGQDQAVKMLKGMGRKGIPHCLLLTGPSGTGKTTTARILKRLLNCSEFDFTELNCADFRGIDMVRDIRDRVDTSPMGGECRIWLVDEFGRTTVDAQNAFLKILEDTPSHVYFMLATTDPQKLLPTIKTRATEIKFRLLNDTEMTGLLKAIAAKVSFKLTDDVLDRVVAVAEGSPRKALVLLNQILTIDTEEDQMAVVTAGVSSAHAIEIARALINPKAAWSTVAALLKTCEDEPETVRRIILGYFSSVLLSGGNLSERAYRVITCFERNFFDSGKAGLAASCWEVVRGK